MGLCRAAGRILTLTLVFSVHPIGGTASASDVRCGVHKVEAMARACAEVLRNRARFVHRPNTPEALRREENSRVRLAKRWAKAESAASEACAKQSSTWQTAWTLLQKRVESALDAAEGPVCRRRLAKTLANSCRMWTRLEIKQIEDSPDAGTSALRLEERLNTRLANLWKMKECAAPTPQQVKNTARQLGGYAAGLATTRSIAAVAAPTGLRFGVAIEAHEVPADPVYEGLLHREANSITAENAMKWRSIHPAPGTWNFGPADQIAERAVNQAMGLRGHTLIWGGTRSPDYVEEASDREVLLEYMEDHITTLVQRYAGAVDQWDVVNEVLPSVIDPPTADGLDDNIFRRVVGADYVAQAFQFAHAADPQAKLYLNENGVLLPGARQDRLIAFVEELLDAGVPLHGIGIQGHLGLTPPAAYPNRQQIADAIQRFTDLGLELEITELDVVTLFFGAFDEPGEPPIKQAALYGWVLRACLENPGCHGVTTWGLGDHLSWVRTFFGFADDPLPFDENWQRKPAYFAIRAECAAAAAIQPPG